MAAINFVAIVAHLQVSPRNIISWVLPGTGIAGLVTVVLVVCLSFMGERIGSPALRLAMMGSIAAALVALGFRLFMSRARRQMLSNYIFPEMSRPAVSIAKIFGLPPRSA